MNDFSNVWRLALANLLLDGQHVSPRGKLTKELPQSTMVVDMRHPVLMIQERKLSYQFMAAEAYWILSGDDSVSGIAPWNNRISNFSDDGHVFYGAYGPKIADQLQYVVDKLVVDPDTRQAGLTIWRENPPETKDVPCTVAIFFNLREDKLNAHVFMRSSDAWLGVPYDVFNFSMLAHLVCGKLNSQDGDRYISPGRLFLTAASSHLYEHNWQHARECAYVDPTTVPQGYSTPTTLFESPKLLMDTLRGLRDSKPGDLLRWWA